MNIDLLLVIVGVDIGWVMIVEVDIIEIVNYTLYPRVKVMVVTVDELVEVLLREIVGNVVTFFVWKGQYQRFLSKSQLIQ